MPTDQPRFEWPLQPRPPVERPFDPPESDFGSGHRGVDLRAEPGQEVRAAGAGYVVFADDLADRGVVSIEHDAVRTTYEPVRPSVERGDRVRTGQVIGTVATGHDGCPRAACLHWGARRGGPPPEYLDPTRLVDHDGPLRLKPWSSR